MHDSTTPQVDDVANSYAKLESEAAEAMKQHARETVRTEIIPMLISGVSDNCSSLSIFLDARGMLDQAIEQFRMTPQEALQAVLRLDRSEATQDGCVCDRDYRCNKSEG